MTLLLASGGNPLGHVLDKRSAVSELLDTNINLSVISVVAGGVVTLAVLLYAARRIRTGPESQGHGRYVTQGRLGQVIEVIVEGLYKQMLEPVMGPRLAKTWLPFLLSIFFFVLTLNLFGLIPFLDLQPLGGYVAAKVQGRDLTSEEAEALVFIGGTATASLSVNIGLAFWAFMAIQWQSLRELGVGGWLAHLAGGDALLKNKGLWFVVPIIFVVEVLGLIIKPAALAIRLFANMVGGHTLMATLMLFGAMALSLGAAAVAGVSLLSGAFAVIITFLELFVAFLQAFIFMFLTAVFISQMSHGDEHHDEEHGHDGHAADDHHGSVSADALSPKPAH